MTRATDPWSVLAVGRWRRVTCLVLALAAGACRGESRQTQPDKGGGSVVVHSSADKEFAELIFRAYEQKTGVGVLPLYDTEETKTAGLTARLLAEREHPKADVFWSSDTSRAVAIAEQGVADPYVPRDPTQISERYRSAAGCGPDSVPASACCSTTPTTYAPKMRPSRSLT